MQRGLLMQSLGCQCGTAALSEEACSTGRCWELREFE